MNHPSRTDTPALELADLFLDAVYTERLDDRQHARGTILCVAEHLESAGEPLRWHTFDPASYFALIEKTLSEKSRMREALLLIGFFGWMGFLGMVAVDDAIAIIDGVVRAAPASPELKELAEQTSCLLPEQAAIPLVS